MSDEKKGEPWESGEIPGDTDGDWTTMDGRKLAPDAIEVHGDTTTLRFTVPPPDDRVRVLGSSCWETRGRWWDDLLGKLITGKVSR